MPNQQRELLHTFLELSQLAQTLRRDVDLHAKLQHQLFITAQALGAAYFPKLQAELDEARREVMQVLASNPKTLNSAMLFPRRIYRMRWEDVQITPEIAKNMQLTGMGVPRKLAARLIKLHRQQVSAISKLTKG